VGYFVCRIVSHDGRDIVHRIKGCVEDDDSHDEHGYKASFLVLLEEVGNGNHHPDQEEDPEDHGGDHADSIKRRRTDRVAFHEMFPYRCKVEGGCRRNRGKEGCRPDEHPVPVVKFHTSEYSAGCICIREAVKAGL